MHNALGAVQSLLVLGGASDIGAAIAARLRKGFQAGERVIRQEWVSVYALKK